MTCVLVVQPSIHGYSCRPFSLPYQISFTALQSSHHMPCRKLASLILLLRSLLSPLLNPSLAFSASSAPSVVPASLAGRSIVCFVMGIFSSMTSPEARSFSSLLRWAFATLRRTFLDFARRNQHQIKAILVQTWWKGDAYRIHHQQLLPLHYHPYSRPSISTAIPGTRAPPAPRGLPYSSSS